MAFFDTVLNVLGVVNEVLEVLVDDENRERDAEELVVWVVKEQ